MGSFFSSPSDRSEWKSDARFAMESGAFCVLCGNPFDIEGDVYDIDPKERRFQWLFDYRLLGNPAHIHIHTVTSDGALVLNTVGSSNVFLSENASFSATGSGFFGIGDGDVVRQTWFDTLREEPGYDTMIPLHDACIDIACRVIENRPACRIDDEANISSLEYLHRLLQDLFHNKEWEDSEARNDLLELCTSSNMYGPRSVMGLGRLEWWGGQYEKFYSDPVEIPNLTEFALKILHASPARDRDLYVRPVSQNSSGLEGLPNELLDQICSYLPVTSIIKLHRLSKTLAMKVPLDSKFWRSSLLDGSLLPHIWDLDIQQLSASALESSRDWRSVARLLASKRFPLSGRDARLESMPHGLWNRCKIWSTVENAVESYLVQEMYRPRVDSRMDRSDVDLLPHSQDRKGKGVLRG